jgi:hypothetical protein
MCEISGQEIYEQWLVNRNRMEVMEDPNLELKGLTGLNKADSILESNSGNQALSSMGMATTS